MHEGAVIGRTRDVLHEGAVDLHDVHAELAQIAERGIARAEIVDRDPAAEILQPRDEAADVVDILDRHCFSDLDDQPFGDPGMRTHQGFDRRPPVRIHGGLRRNVEAEPDVGRFRELGDHELKHAVIDETDQAELLRHRHNVRREQELAILLLHPHQAFVERRLTRTRIDHGLEGGEDAALVQRGDDLVGDADVDAALRIALDVRTPHRERAGAAALCRLEDFLGPVDCFIGGPRIARAADRADRGGDRHGA